MFEELSFGENIKVWSKIADTSLNKLLKIKVVFLSQTTYFSFRMGMAQILVVEVKRKTVLKMSKNYQRSMCNEVQYCFSSPVINAFTELTSNVSV